MDIDRQLGDVVSSEDVLSYLRSLDRDAGVEASHE
jgi:hypothetical protein